jgi:carbon-monoxide dehydrogenase large subunit
MGEFAIGREVPRFEDARLVTGRGSYIDDIVLPRMAFAYVVRSQHAHARIRSIDVTRVRSAPGVLCVLTGGDWQASGLGDLPSADGGLKRSGGHPMYRPPSPALVRDRVRWVGDYVAFIVAETLNLAKDAAELVEVDYEPLPAVVSTEAALHDGAALVWDECGDNVCFVQSMGDKEAAEAAFARAQALGRGREGSLRVGVSPDLVPFRYQRE